MAKRYVTDIIGDDYKNWKPGDCILITNGTGSGKTYFVKNNLLNAIEKYENEKSHTRRIRIYSI